MVSLDSGRTMDGHRVYADLVAVIIDVLATRRGGDDDAVGRDEVGGGGVKDEVEAGLAPELTDSMVDIIAVVLEDVISLGL